MPFLHRHILTLLLASLCTNASMAMSPQDLVAPISSPPTPQIFAPGVASGPANDGSPAFSPDGNTIFFTCELGSNCRVAQGPG
jgi:WD40-like Beta Propeller Repeat